MNKPSTLVITIPLVIAGLVVAGVLAFRIISQQADSGRSVSSYLPAGNTAPIQGHLLPKFSTASGTPTIGFGNLQAANPVWDLDQQFIASADDGGDATISALLSQAASL